MSTFTLQKSIRLPHHILEVKSIIIEDNLNYLRLSEGVRIEGKLILNGEIICEVDAITILESVEVDVFVPNKRICEVKSLKLNVKDYTYKIEEKDIHFEINCALEGEEYLEETFSVEKKVKRPIKTPKKIIHDQLLENTRGLISEAEHDMLEQAILNDDCEIISTKENLEFPFKIIDESIELEIPNDSSEIAMETMGMKIDPSEVRVNDEPIMVSVDEIKEEIPFKDVKNDKLFDCENYMVFTRFYRVKDGETYASIATKLNLDVNLLVKRNNNKNLSEGILIELSQ